LNSFEKKQAAKRKYIFTLINEMLLMTTPLQNENAMKLIWI